MAQQPRWWHPPERWLQWVGWRDSRVALGLLLVLAFVLRVHRLGTESLWLDEAYSWAVTRHGVVEAWSLTAGDVHPPLYYLLLSAWSGLLGESEVAMRMLSVVASVLLVGAVYLLGRELYTHGTGLLAGALVALSSFHLFYAQEVRMYALLGLLSTASFMAYHRVVVVGEPTRGELAAYLGVTVALVYTHVFGFLVLAAQHVHYLARATVAGLSRRQVGTWVGLQAGVGLLFIPWLVPLLGQARRVTSGFWIQEPSVDHLWHTFETFAGSPELWLVLAIAGTGALLAKVPWPWRERGASGQRGGDTGEHWGRPAPGALLLIWLVVPVLAAFAISKLVTPVYVDRYLIGASPALFLLAARGITLVPGRLPQVVAVVLVLALSGHAVTGMYEASTRAQWREAAAYVEENARPGELVLFDGFSAQLPFDYYARTPLDRAGYLGAHGLVDQRPINNLTGLADDHRTLWLVLSHSQHEEEILDVLRGQYEPVEFEIFDSVMVWRFQAR